MNKISFLFISFGIEIIIKILKIKNEKNNTLVYSSNIVFFFIKQKMSRKYTSFICLNMKDIS